MANSELYPPADSFRENAYFNSKDEYQSEYDRSISDPDAFWAEKASEYYWFKKWDTVSEVNFDRNKGPISVKWFEGGQTNIAYNCLDRHLDNRSDQVAIIWEGNEPGEDRTITYRELHEEVSKFANVLKSRGVKKGDRVSIYLPMIPELAISMLACARIGAIHSIVFGGFSAEALADRIADATCTVLITCNGTHRGDRPIPMKPVADEAMTNAETQMGVPVDTCIVVERIAGSEGVDCEMQDGRDLWWDDVMADASPNSECEVMEAEDPLFILYTSGSTGKPKGVQHTTGGYMVYASQTHKYIFDYHDGDIYFCTADIGWVTGHSYIVYGPLANGATTLMFEGILPGTRPVLADSRKVECEPVLHRADRNQGDCPARRRMARQVRNEVTEVAGIGWRADQPGSVALVPQAGRQGTLPDRRYLVADGNRRHSHHHTTRGYPDQAGRSNCAILRNRARNSRSRKR